MYKLVLVHIVILSCICGCKGKHKNERTVISHELSDSAMFVPSQSPLLITPDAFNILPIDFVTIRTKDKIYNGVSVYKINKTLAGYQDTFSVIYPFEVKGNIDFSTLRCALDIDTGCEVWINRKQVFPLSSGHFLNENYLLYEIGKYSCNGRNEISVLFQSTNKMRERMAFILGGFSVQPVDTGFHILQPAILHTGDWVEQGMPFYNDAVTYSKIYTFEENRSARTLFLPKWCGSSAMVFINKELVEVIGKDERKLDIGSFLLSGENKIDIKILGMRENTTGPFYLSDTLSQIPPSGDCYKVLPSGLYGDFSIGEP